MGLKILREMRGSALWDACKWIFQKRWPFLMPVAYALWAAIRSRPDWAVASCLFIASLIIAGSQEYLRRRKPRESADQKTFNALQKVLPSTSIAQLRTRHFSSTFEWNLDRVLLEFHQWDIISEHRFLDPVLERIHGGLRDAVDVLVHKVHFYSELLTEDGRSRGFSPLGKIEDMTEFEGHRNEVYEAAKAVCDAYDDLVQTARRKFEL
jgi:hypothetical protein